MDQVWADPEDLPLIKELLAACGLHADDLQAYHAEHFLLVREADALIGTVGLELGGDVALLRSLAVASDHRCKGLASRLLRAIEQHARSLGVRTLYLLTLTAEGFFEARGYRRAARDQAPAALQETSEFKSVCPATAVCMRKELHS